jgi:quercetin dioxygenase-like cupin family protein
MTNTPTTQPEHEFQTISEGVAMRVLRRHPDKGTTFLIRMQKGARAMLHDHPGGEETYMLEGRLRIQGRTDAARAPVPDVVLSPGEYVFCPPGEIHEGVAEEEALFFVVAPGGVVRVAR